MPRQRTVTPREPSLDLVKIISEGTYTNFSSALKEFASNAFDADAKTVRITMSDECDTITIHDDGRGMSTKDFQESYASIARCGKPLPGTARGKTRKGRQHIGRFGIGALAIIHIADRFCVRSTKSGSNRGFEAEIDLAKVRKQYGKGRDLSKWWRFTVSDWTNEPKANHFTEIVCEGLTQNIRQLLQRPGQKNLDETFASVRQLGGIDELIWRLGIICPVPYAAGLPFEKRHLQRPQDNTIFAKSGRLQKNDFRVFVNAEEVTRRILLPAYGDKAFGQTIARDLAYQRGLGHKIQIVHSPPGIDLKYDGYLATQAFQVFPEEVRGILIRLRGVGIGWHRTLNLQGKLPSTLFTNLSGEIWVDGLDDALQFDRESFREDHPLFVQLRSHLAQMLEVEAKEFRQRSRRRRALIKAASQGRVKGREKPTKKKDETKPGAKGQPEPEVDRHGKVSGKYLVPIDIFDAITDTPRAFENLLNQINGCWGAAYYEACALVCRRLVEIMIIELYSRRGLKEELTHSKTRKFVGLKKLIDKLNGDARFGLGRHITDELHKVKTVGDLAAHDHMVRIRKQDIDTIPIRFSVERLAYLIGQEPPAR